MKTPKRTIPCPQCGAPLEIGTTVIKSWDECYEVPAFFCSRSGEEITLPFKYAKEFSARWKRKNREARLRNRIRVDLYHRMMEKYWKNCTMDCLDALTMREDMDGAYGQDVEGS